MYEWLDLTTFPGGQLTSNQMVSQSVASVVLSNPKKVHAGNGKEIHTPETEVGKI